VAHLADDDKGTVLLLAQRFGGDAPAANFFSRAREQAEKRTAELRSRRGFCAA